MKNSHLIRERQYKRERRFLLNLYFLSIFLVTILDVLFRANHQPKHNRKFTIERRGDDGRSVWFVQVERPHTRTAFAVALEYFPDAQPGGHYSGNTYRFQRPSIGDWVYVTINDDNP